MRKLTFPTMLCLLLFTGYVFSQEETTGAYDALARKVEKKIRDNKKTQVENLKVSNDQGTIHLEGVVKLYGSRYMAEKNARKVDGVKDVKNEIALAASQVDDVDIQIEVINRVRSNLTGSPFDLINVRVNNGFVLLTGTVRDQSLVDDSFNDTIWVPGVRGVENRIEFASLGASDERLRQTIYTRIRSEFPQYFMGKDPSVLILVQSGRVQLVGYVDSNVSREKIGSMIRSIRGVLSVDNRLQGR